MNYFLLLNSLILKIIFPSGEYELYTEDSIPPLCIKTNNTIGYDNCLVK